MAAAAQAGQKGGRFFLYVFYAFNGLMLWWLLSYWGRVAPDLSTGSEAEQAGAAIGTTLGTGFILLMWTLGSVITGLLALLTRGNSGRGAAQPEYGFGGALPAQASVPRAFGAAPDAGRSRESFGSHRAAIAQSGSSGWSWNGVFFWTTLAICGLIILGVIGQLVEPDSGKTGDAAREVKQVPAAQPVKPPAKEGPRAKDEAKSFSNFLTVDNLRLSKLVTTTAAIVTVRIPTKIRRVKCAIKEGNRYLGVGNGYDASPPVTDVQVLIPGVGYGSGSRLRAECWSD